MTSSLVGLLDELRTRRDELRTMCEAELSEAQRSGREQLNTRERSMLSDLRGITQRITELQSERDRAGLGGTSLPGKLSRRANSGARVAPIGFDLDELRRAHARLTGGEAVRLEARAFATASPILPAELAPWVTELQHEGRILDHLPVFALEAPSVEIVQVNSVTGAAGIVAEGATKPEIVPVTTPLTVTAEKIAATVGLSYEALSDFDVFSNYVRIELQRQVVQAENAELLYGAGGTGHLNGFFAATGILSFDASTAAQDIDAVEQSIAAMRVGPSLATPNLVVLNPSTWSSIRRTKDTLGRYLLSADPAEDEADSIWGVDVVVTTQCSPGDGLLVDTTKYGRAVVREPLSMRIGWANDDFVRNILRTVSEERLNNAIERPSSVLWIKNLGASTTTMARSAPKK